MWLIICPSLCDLWDRIWDEITNIIGVQLSSEIHNIPDEEFLYIMLGKKWDSIDDIDIMMNSYVVSLHIYPSWME